MSPAPGGVLGRLLGLACPGLGLRWLRPEGRQLGEWGECHVARVLRRRGWCILARDLRTPWAQVDLLARADGELVLVEVKSARLPDGVTQPLHWRPGDSLTHAQIRRLERAGRHLARVTGFRGAVRIDLVEVLVGSGGRICVLQRSAVAG